MLLNKRPNPQGKGLVPIMDSLVGSRARNCVPAKHIDRITSELFTSLFILHSRFQFKPVMGRPYYLYRRKDNSFHMSMISPEEWGGPAFGQYIGECVLQQDITWTLALASEARQDEALLRLIESRRRQFENAMHEADSVDDLLPVYLESLPFYPRVFASALANSLKESMQRSGIQGLSYAQAKGLLEQE